MAAITSNRIFGLDALRATAIILVVINHSIQLILPIFKISTLGFVLGKIIFTTVSPFGILGVELFFALSGYLIGGILIREFMESETFTVKSGALFLIRRWFRTLPNYYLILILFVLLGFLQNRNDGDWHFMFFIQNLYHPVPAFFSESWSLAVEEWFYLSLPIILYIMAKLKGISRQRVLFSIILIYIILFFVVKLLNAIFSIYSNHESGLRTVVLFRLDAVMYGVLMAWLMHFSPTFIAAWRRRLFVTGVLGVIALTMLDYLGKDYKFEYYDRFPVYRFVSATFLYSLLPFFFSFLIPAASKVRAIPNKFISKVVVHISRISYSLYLTHWSLILVPFFKPIKYSNFGYNLCGYFAYWIVVISVSTLLYRYFEHPIMNLRDALGPRDAAQKTTLLPRTGGLNLKTLG